MARSSFMGAVATAFPDAAEPARKEERACTATSGASFEPFSVGTGDLKGATPLWVAAFDMHDPVYSFGTMDASGSSERPEIVRALLAGGADWRLATVDQTTPLMVAAGLGHGTYLPGKPRGDPTPDAEATVQTDVPVPGVAGDR